MNSRETTNRFLWIASGIWLEPIHRKAGRQFGKQVKGEKENQRIANISSVCVPRILSKFKHFSFWIPFQCKSNEEIWKIRSGKLNTRCFFCNRGNIIFPLLRQESKCKKRNWRRRNDRNKCIQHSNLTPDFSPCLRQWRNFQTEKDNS